MLDIELYFLKYAGSAEVTSLIFKEQIEFSPSGF